MLVPFGNDDKDQCALFWVDVCKTINELDNCVHEVAFAQKGGSQFDTAIYHETLAPAQLEAYAAKEKNVGLLSSCERDFLPVKMGTTGKRMATNQCVKRKNILIFDLDFKDVEPQYKAVLGAEKEQLVAALCEKFLAALVANKTPYWFVSLSGNGLHLYFKLQQALLIPTPKDYQKLYTPLLEHLQCVTMMKLDKACSNPARIMRLPLSTNWKDEKEPRRGMILAYQPTMYADKLVDILSSQGQRSEQASNFHGKQHLIEKLDLVRVLKYFDYKKMDSITEFNGKVKCSSPFSNDTKPSLFYDNQRKVFYDFSTAQGGDIFNLIAMFAALDIKRDFRAVLQYARKIVGLVEETARGEKPGLFVLNEGGVYFRTKIDDDETPYWVSSFIQVAAYNRDILNQGWGRQLLIRDQEGREKAWAMPMELLAGDGLELRKKLLNLGAALNPSKMAKTYLIQYLTMQKPVQFFRSITQLGWNDQRYVLPDMMIAANQSSAEPIVLQTTLNLRTFHPKGSLAEWQQEIGCHIPANPLLLLALGAALAAPLLYLTGDENFGLHLVGPSSIGKTIALDVAGSVWGGGRVGGYKTRWRTTVNGLEALAVKHNDALLVLDELGEVSPKAAAAAAYMLANGSGKVRSTREGGLTEPAEWRLIFLSAGEVDLSAHLESEGMAAKAGQEVRMLNIDANCAQHGVFHELGKFSQASALADHLRLASRCQYGTVIREYLDNLVKLRQPTSLLKELQHAFIRLHQKAAHLGQTQRVLQRFSLLYAACELARRFAIIEAQEGSLAQSIAYFFAQWHAKQAGASIEANQIISQIRLYLQTYGLSRFPDIEEMRRGQTTTQCAGFRRRNEAGDYDWLVLSEVFRKEICRGLNFKLALKTLRDGSLLILGPDGKSTTLMRIPNLGMVRIYCLVAECVSK